MGRRVPLKRTGVFTEQGCRRKRVGEQRPSMPTAGERPRADILSIPRRSRLGQVAQLPEHREKPGLQFFVPVRNLTRWYPVRGQQIAKSPMYDTGHAAQTPPSPSRHLTLAGTLNTTPGGHSQTCLGPRNLKLGTWPSKRDVEVAIW